MNSVDAACTPCGRAFRWLCGEPLRCPNCYELVQPQSVTVEQSRQEQAARRQSKGDAAADGTDIEEGQQR